MGNNTSIEELNQLPNFEQDYVQLTTSRGDTLFRNKYTGQEIQAYDIVLDNQAQFDRELLVYNFRKNNPCLVNVLFIQDNTVQNICSTHYQITLYIQHIPLRLSNVKDIPYPDSLHLIETCLKGFHSLYQKGGYFRVEQDLIGINSFGEAKVWINSFFEVSTPQIDASQYIGTQSDIVLRIIGLIERNTDQTSTQLSFPEFYKSSPCNNSFRQAIAKFYEYIVLTKQDVPPIMQCTLPILKPGYQLKTSKVTAPIISNPIQPTIIQHVIHNNENMNTNINKPNTALVNPTLRKTFYTPSVMMTQSNKLKTTPEVIHISDKQHIVDLKQELKNHHYQIPTQSIQFNSHKNFVKQARTTSTHLNRFSQNTVNKINIKSISPRINSVFVLKSDQVIQPLQQIQKPVALSSHYVPSKSLSVQNINVIPPTYFVQQNSPVIQQRQYSVIVPHPVPIISKPQNLSLQFNEHHIPQFNIPSVPKTTRVIRPTSNFQNFFAIQKNKFLKKNQINPRLIPLINEVQSQITIYPTERIHQQLPKQTQLYTANHTSSTIQFDSLKLKSQSYPVYRSQNSQKNIIGMSPQFRKIPHTELVKNNIIPLVQQFKKTTIQSISKQLQNPNTQVYVQQRQMQRPGSIASFFPRYQNIIHTI